MQASFLPGRSGDPLDAAWDCVGVVLGLLLAWLVLRRRQTARASSTRW
jgi:VanZ family protein